MKKALEKESFVKLNRIPQQHNVNAPAHLLSTKLGVAVTPFTQS